jgi:hypothetical protein
MKKFILKWGKGSICEIQIIYKTLTIEAENIDNINPLEILPEYIKRKVPYVRKIHTSKTKRNYDYGSWVDFIEAEEIDYQKRTDTSYQSYF